LSFESPPLLESDIPGLDLLGRGKVRDIYSIGDNLLLVTTDRISAYDSVIPTPIPGKGAVLTAISAFWFEKTSHLVKNHMLSTDVEEMDLPSGTNIDSLRGRTMLVRKTNPLPIECVARGYLAGSGWADYQNTGKVCGIPLPDGLHESQRLPSTIYTPATKAETGHDENISFEESSDLVGTQLAEKVRDLTIGIYEYGHEHARERGIILADTKFEFGLIGEDLILIDEVLTPDSSRFWELSTYKEGTSPSSYDKQYVRDYLTDSGWDRNPPAPTLPEQVVIDTSAKYMEALERISS